MSTEFNNRVYGCAIIKSINSNYNADFSHRPRTLPNGVVYATDKTLKWSVRNFWKQVKGKQVFYSKSLDENMSPRSLDETAELLLGKDVVTIGDSKKLRLATLKGLLSFIDVRLFGGTYAVKKANISLHGCCQISHGVNRFPENDIYSEQIMSPFRNSNEKSESSTMTTLGTQTKLAEGHYVHHFSVNPGNIKEDASRAEADLLSTEDIGLLKEGLCRGVSFYDSTSKIGTDNELLLWVQLKPESELILPSFVSLIDVKNDENRTIDLTKISELIEANQGEIESVEIYYDDKATTVKNVPQMAKKSSL